MYENFQESFRMQVEVMGMDPAEHDQMKVFLALIKRMFIDTNPILLGITMAVSLLHSIFDFLAFKNGISC
jgi:hypothetical protein